jgi:alpha-galactosidase/6-phospho-beta-glucosidase family protein
MEKRESLRHASSWPVLPRVTFQDENENEHIPHASIYEDEKYEGRNSHELVDMTHTYQTNTESPSTLVEDVSTMDYDKENPDAELMSAAMVQAKLDGYSDEYAKHIAESARIVNSVWDDKRTRFTSNVTTNGSVLSALIRMEGSQKRGKPRRRNGAKKVSHIFLKFTKMLEYNPTH